MNTLLLSNGYTITYNSISNTAIYKFLSQRNIQPPAVPTYTDDKGVEQENLFSPKYADALVVHQKNIELAMLEIMFTNCVVFNEEWKKTKQWIDCEYMINNQFILSKKNIPLSFLKFVVLDNIYDQSTLANKVFLTETRVYDIFGTVSIQREGVDIHKAYLKNTIDTRIEVQPIFVGIHQLVNPLDEFNACVAGNMSWSKWYNCEYSLDEKASVVALSRLNRVRDIHSDDAIHIESERQSKKKN